MLYMLKNFTLTQIAIGFLAIPLLLYPIYFKPNRLASLFFVVN